MLSAASIVIACSVLFKTILVFYSFITIFAFVAWTDLEVMKDRKKRGRSSQ